MHRRITKVTQRITKETLRGIVDNLNAITKHHYGLEGAYGKWQLVKHVNGTDTRDGIETITALRTKPEIAYILWAIDKMLRCEVSS